MYGPRPGPLHRQSAASPAALQERESGCRSPCGSSHQAVEHMQRATLQQSWDLQQSWGSEHPPFHLRRRGRVEELLAAEGMVVSMPLAAHEAICPSPVFSRHLRLPCSWYWARVASAQCTSEV